VLGRTPVYVGFARWATRCRPPILLRVQFGTSIAAGAWAGVAQDN